MRIWSSSLLLLLTLAIGCTDATTADPDGAPLPTATETRPMGPVPVGIHWQGPTPRSWTGPWNDCPKSPDS